MSGEGSEPWVLKLGNYLSRPKDDPNAEGWAVSLGKYLNERQPGPWSIIANEKPQDPLALRLGTFLNETRPIGVLHSAAGTEEESASSEPVVLRCGRRARSNRHWRRQRANPSPARF